MMPLLSDIISDLYGSLLQLQSKNMRYKITLQDMKLQQTTPVMK